MKSVFVLLALLFISPAAMIAQDWKSIAAKSDSASFATKINPRQFGVDGNAALDNLNEHISLLGDSALFSYLRNWNDYPAPRKRGVICQYFIQMDSNYRVPFLVYIPRNYDHRKKTTLLLYFKGGWMSRKSLPNGYAKEIVTDNPSFDYLDENNIIEIFPALENRLAIYGNYGYQHLQHMISETKRHFNIDDNRVFLSGFSDGGKTTYLAYNLVPTSFACFYPINGSIVSWPNFQNYLNRPAISFVAGKDELTDPRSIRTRAAYAVSLGADWKYRELKDRKHLYHTYQDKILPILFEDIKRRVRNPFPSHISYHRGFNYAPFTGVDWIQMQVNTELAPSASHFTDSIHTYAGDGEETAYLYGEKTGQLKASYFDNTFTVETSMVEEIEIYISPLMVDMNVPISVIINGKQVFSEKVSYSRPFMLERFRRLMDREQLWVNSIRLKVPTEVR